MMLKELVTANELRNLMLVAIRERGYILSDRCIDIYESSEPNTNWVFGTDTTVSEECRRQLNEILGILRLKYDMKK